MVIHTPPQLIGNHFGVLCMSMTQKQLAANQANAQKSTGPKTDEGKQTASKNAIKHGLNTLGFLLRLQKNNNFTTDLQNLGALKYEETKPTFLPPQLPQTPAPQPLATTPPPPTKKPKFLVFQTRKFCLIGGSWPPAKDTLGQTRRLPPTEL